MSFQLQELDHDGNSKPVLVTITKVNTRTELHGEERVRAADICFKVSGENVLLDLLKPGLREHHFFNKSLTAGQEPLPGVVIPLPNVRHPELPLEYVFAKGQKWRGYRFLRDYGTREEDMDFTDVVLANLHYEFAEGGTTTIYGTVQFNGEELTDNELYGRISGLAAEGEAFIRLIAPGELLPAKKGYRAGRPDTPQTPAKSGAQAELGDGGGGEDGEDGLDPESPEGKLAATEPQA